MEAIENKNPQKMSKLALISFVLSLFYCIYLVAHFFGSIGNGASDAEKIWAGLATMIVMPHLVVTSIGMIFNGLGCFMKKRGFVLTGAILYSVAIFLFPVYFMFIILQMIFSYIAYAKMK